MIQEPVVTAAREVLGQFLTNRRKELKLNQDEVALKSGIARRTVSKIETGENYEVSALLRYLHALDLYIFFGSKDGKHLDFEHMKEKMNETDPYHSGK